MDNKAVIISDCEKNPLKLLSSVKMFALHVPSFTSRYLLDQAHLLTP